MSLIVVGFVGIIFIGVGMVITGIVTNPKNAEALDEMSGEH